MSEIIEEMKHAAKTLKKEADYPYTAGLLERAAERMQDMEALIVKMREELDSAQTRRAPDG